MATLNSSPFTIPVASVRPAVQTLTWRDVEARVREIARKRPPCPVYGVPTGGSLVALMLAREWNTTVLDAPPKTRNENALVIDDIMDSGTTLKPFIDAGVQTEALYCSKPENLPHVPNAAQSFGWVHFPWEHEPAPTDAVVRLLQHIGEDPRREGLLDTPKRVVKAWTEMTSGYAENPTEILARTFAESSDEMIVLRDIEFVSVCEHHMMAFTGVAHVGYVPQDNVVVGLSKLARLVECYARRLQIQERMTSQITNAIMDNVNAKGAACVVKAHHSCMGCRGVKKQSASMVTSSLLGCFREPATRHEFLNIIKI